VRSDDAEDDGAHDGGGPPDGPMPPSGFGVTEVFPTGPAWADAADEPAKGADDKDGEEGDEANDVSIHSDGGEGFFDFCRASFQGAV